jgi:hypothetical protein
MTKKLVLFITLFLLTVSCKSSKKKKIANSENEIITQLIHKYPSLAEDTIGNYQLIRTVTIGKKDISLKLFSIKNDRNTSNEIIVINNSKGIKYAIPLFSNNFRKYWNFENETKTF